MKKNKTKDILDIQNWQISDETLKRIAIKESQSKPNAARKILKVDAIQLYCLLKTFISDFPNGTLTTVEEFINPQKSMPIDRLIWWDFELKYEAYNLHIVRHPNLVEIIYSRDLPFEVEDFFIMNFKKYKKQLHETLQTFTKYKLYENHYYSYKKFIKYLDMEIKKIDIEMPRFDPRGIDVIENNLKSVEKNWKKASIYFQNTLKYHYLSKSFIINLAFLIESYVNTVIRIIYTQDTTVDLKKTLNLQLKDRIKFLIPNVNFDDKVIQATLKLIDLRNKQVHSDLNHCSSEVGYAYFDGDFPVFDIKRTHFFVDLAEKAFLSFSKEDLNNMYENTMEFIRITEERLTSHFDYFNVNFINIPLERETLAINTLTKSYGVIFPETVVSMYAGKHK